MLLTSETEIQTENSLILFYFSSKNPKPKTTKFETYLFVFLGGKSLRHTKENTQGKVNNLLMFFSIDISRVKFKWNDRPHCLGVIEAL